MISAHSRVCSCLAIVSAFLWEQEMTLINSTVDPHRNDDIRVSDICYTQLVVFARICRTIHLRLPDLGDGCECVVSIIVAMLAVADFKVRVCHCATMGSVDNMLSQRLCFSTIKRVVPRDDSREED